MSMSYQELENELASVLASAEQLLPMESFAEARHYMNHNEFELALDTAAATIVSSGTHVSSDLHTRFVALGNKMQMDKSHWDSIRAE